MKITELTAHLSRALIPVLVLYPISRKCLFRALSRNKLCCLGGNQSVVIAYGCGGCGISGASVGLEKQQLTDEAYARREDGKG
jgi:hypothetical protein